MTTTIHPDTLRYGLIDAANAARLAYGEESDRISWDDWQNAYNTAQSAMSADHWAVFEPILLGIPAGPARDAFLTVTVKHINNKTWG